MPSFVCLALFQSNKFLIFDAMILPFFPVPFMEQKTFQKFLNKIVAEFLHAPLQDLDFDTKEKEMCRPIPIEDQHTMLKVQF